jgi:hypothetical protein
VQNATPATVTFNVNIAAVTSVPPDRFSVVRGGNAYEGTALSRSGAVVSITYGTISSPSGLSNRIQYTDAGPGPKLLDVDGVQVPSFTWVF